MSYEGYIQFLCPSGHLWTQDVYSDRHNCLFCGESAIWENDVDETNGLPECKACYGGGGTPHPDRAGFMTCTECNGRGHLAHYDDEVILEVATEATWDECPCCHHKTLKEERTYKIPNDKGRMLK